MNENVKDFIELAIQPINEGDWAEVIELWYSSASANFTYNDDDFNDLSETLSKAGIPFLEVSLQARKEFMGKLLNQILHEELEGMTYYGKSEIKKNDILMLVDSDLGFIKEELEEILDDVAENAYNLEVDFTCYYVR